MKLSKILLNIAVITSAIFASSCNDFLDEMPDNRTELDTQEKVKKILVTAYPDRYFSLVTELSSDNIDDYGELNPNSERFLEQVAHWENVTETDNEDLQSVWEACYSAITSANMALAAIEEMGSPAELLPYKGEALLCRAYSHFVLVNIFAKHYNTQTSTSDLGITYMEKPEATLDPKYERESVASIYAKIDKDLKEGLPLIDDAGYAIPKYHFNKKAAYAFASRFYLYYEKWDDVISCANVVLTSSPATMLRDYKALGNLTDDFDVQSNAYVSSEEKSNLLLFACTSEMGLIFGPYSFGCRFSHGTLLSTTETIQAEGPWGEFEPDTYNYAPSTYTGPNFDMALFAKCPQTFEYSDPVARIGNYKSVFVALSADETLLCRAEAYAMKKDYDKSASDLNLWAANFVSNCPTITSDLINSFYGSIEYHTPTAPTIKKKLNPKFTIEAGTQENFIQCVLHFRRLATLHDGLRWFDIKRYGIEITRRVVDANGNIKVKETLTADDNRRAMQIPKNVVNAGYTPNPR